ncbi:hypothetical protein ADN00_17950 [Ornatilinea apprima]|uniref:Uncharacterized protein n=1 Tax=Ornatilinea apprima TaxID=1134406 RepID=A0A0P6XIG6_9CHLR|nr:hypothetical protein [Ornatilinea apprima]KPL70913.1 hypothetical protein ADN00_17950 [Ornatilinea apprima]
MKTSSRTLTILSVLAGLLGLAAALAGLFWPAEGSPFTVTSVHGTQVELWGQGLYRFDAYFRAPIFRGGDAVTAFIAFPLLVFAIIANAKGSRRGRLLLAGTLTYFLYNMASLALGTAYNPMLLVYILGFSASFFALIEAIASLDKPALAAHVTSRMPHKAIAIFMFIAGLSVFVWLLDVINFLTTGQFPETLATYTTEITTVLDIGLITPVAYLAGIRLLQRRPIGYVLAAIMLLMNIFIGLVVISQTIFQSAAGISLPPQVMVIFVGTFVVTSVAAIVLAVLFFRSVEED